MVRRDSVRRGDYLGGSVTHRDAQARARSMGTSLRSSPTAQISVALIPQRSARCKIADHLLASGAMSSHIVPAYRGLLDERSSLIAQTLVDERLESEHLVAGSDRAQMEMGSALPVAFHPPGIDPGVFLVQPHVLVKMMSARRVGRHHEVMSSRVMIHEADRWLPFTANRSSTEAITSDARSARHSVAWVAGSLTNAPELHTIGTLSSSCSATGSARR